MKKIIILIGLIILITGCKTTEERQAIKNNLNTVYSSSEKSIMIYASRWRMAANIGDSLKVLAVNHCKQYNKFAFYYKPGVYAGTWVGDNFVDIFHCFDNWDKYRTVEELGLGGDPAYRIKVYWSNYDYDLAKERRKEKEEKENLIKAEKAEKEKINKQIYTCSSYGFEQGSEPFRQCINDLMKLELEYTKLHNEQLLLEAQIEQAKASKQSNLSSELQLQALIAQQSQALEIQNFNSGMNSLLLGLELMTPSQPTTPTITCHDFGTITQCF